MTWPSPPFSFARYLCLFVIQAFVARSVIERPHSIEGTDHLRDSRGRGALSGKTLPCLDTQDFTCNRSPCSTAPESLQSADFPGYGS